MKVKLAIGERELLILVIVLLLLYSRKDLVEILSLLL